MHDQNTQQMMKYAQQDLQSWMAQAPRDTNEQTIKAWQDGYIAGVQRGVESATVETPIEEL